MVYKRAVLFLLVTHSGWLAAQTNRVGGVVAGTVVDDLNGRGVGRVKVYAVRVSPTTLTTASEVTANDGSFQLNPLAAGAYKICATDTVSKYAPNCILMDQTEAIAVNWGQTSGAVVRLKPGYRLKIRVNDPRGHLSRREGTRAIGMTFVLSDGKGNQHLVSPLAKDSAGFDYELIVPADTQLTLRALAQGAAVRDEGSKVLGTSAEAYTFSETTARINAGTSQKTFVFQVDAAR